MVLALLERLMRENLSQMIDVENKHRQVLKEKRKEKKNRIIDIKQFKTSMKWDHFSESLFFSSIFQTPLYLAVVANQPQMVSMFVQRNANPNSMAQVSNLAGSLSIPFIRNQVISLINPMNNLVHSVFLVLGGLFATACTVVNLATVYGVIFAPCNFCPSSLAKDFAPSWIRLDFVMVKERWFETFEFIQS